VTDPGLEQSLRRALAALARRGREAADLLANEGIVVDRLSVSRPVDGIPLDALDKLIIHTRHLLVLAQALGGKPGSGGAVLGVVRYLLDQQRKQLPSSR
jgi:hypothetical protein